MHNIKMQRAGDEALDKFLGLLPAADLERWAWFVWLMGFEPGMQALRRTTFWEFTLRQFPTLGES